MERSAQYFSLEAFLVHQGLAVARKTKAFNFSHTYLYVQVILGKLTSGMNECETLSL